MLNNLELLEKLVPVFTTTIGGKQVQVCDARALHAYLENKDMFANWIKARIEKYEFQENIDYSIALVNSKAVNGGQNRKDYHLTINMAKELGMVENNTRGREIRRYFIEMEQKAYEQATQPTAIPVLESPAALRGILLSYVDKVIALEAAVKELQPQAEALQRISEGVGSQCITDAAKALKVQPRALFRFLRGIGWIYRRAEDKRWVGYQAHVQSGFLEHRFHTSFDNNWFAEEAVQPMLTPKGITKLASLLSIKNCGIKS